MVPRRKSRGSGRTDHRPGAWKLQQAEVTYAEAALEVLKAAPEPLTAEEVVNEAIRLQLIRPRGKTPVRTMSAIFYAHPPAGLVRVYKRGRMRARRGTVRWALK